MLVQAKQRKPTAFTPELSVWQFGSCKLCDAAFTPVRNKDIAHRVANRHYGGVQHYKNERHAELMMRAFDLDCVYDLVDGRTFWCACGGHTWHWRTMAIHLRESKECLSQLEQRRSSTSEGDSGEGTDESGSEDAEDSEDEAARSGKDEAANGTSTPALEMPEEDFWRC